jgi:hypothetical protein
MDGFDLSTLVEDRGQISAAAEAKQVRFTEGRCIILMLFGFVTMARHLCHRTRIMFVRGRIYYMTAKQEHGAAQPNAHKAGKRHPYIFQCGFLT